MSRNSFIKELKNIIDKNVNDANSPNLINYFGIFENAKKDFEEGKINEYTFKITRVMKERVR